MHIFIQSVRLKLSSKHESYLSSAGCPRKNIFVDTVPELLSPHMKPTEPSSRPQVDVDLEAAAKLLALSTVAGFARVATVARAAVVVGTSIVVAVVVATVRVRVCGQQKIEEGRSDRNVSMRREPVPHGKSKSRDDDTVRTVIRGARARIGATWRVVVVSLTVSSGSFRHRGVVVGSK